MKKILFFTPAMISAIFYGGVALADIGAISPVVIVWLVLFFMSGVLLSKGIFWGSLLGVLPAIHLIYMGTKATGQIISEIPIGIIVLLFYLLCGGFIFYNHQKQHTA